MRVSADRADRELNWLPDSGADVDALTVRDVATIDSDLHRNLAADRHTVRAANSAQLKSLGTIPASFHLNGRLCQMVLHVYHQLSISLLSKATCIKLGLLEEGWPHTRLTKAAVLSVEVPPPHHRQG